MFALIRAFRLGMFNTDLLKQIAGKDLKSGLVVGIIALPMSAGIALASGFPPFAGILTSLIGGLLVSFISGSRLCIKGPAGGLSALTFGCVLVLGEGNIMQGYGLTLGVIMISGVFQIIFSFARMGNLGDFFPAAAIHGMLASLGFIMVVKQIPPLLGSTISLTDTINILSNIPQIISTSNPKIALLGIVCLLIFYTYNFFLKNLATFLPTVIVMLIVAIPTGIILGLNTEHIYNFGQNTYQIIPKLVLLDFPNDFAKTLGNPDFSKIITVEFWFFALAFSLAGNIESLITCKAVDNIDPWHRQTDYNRDLLAIGVGNVVSGLFGGLPMISESKRSIINVHLGASTLASNFFHSIALVIIIFSAQPIIRLIPLCALSAYLIFIGIRMTLPKEFSKSYSIGKEQFFVFTIVFVSTIVFNLLTGILLGTLLELLINLYFGASVKSLFKATLEINKVSDYKHDVKISGPAIFSNFLLSKKSLNSIPKSSNVIFDFSQATLVDHSFLDNLAHYEATRTITGGSIVLTGLEYHHQVSKHPLASRRIIKNELTQRQKELGEYAEANGIDFENRRITNSNRYSAFLSNKWKETYHENTIKYNLDDLTVEICDINLESASTTRQHLAVTIFMISNLHEDIPNLILQQEGFNGGLFELENTNDYNFLEYPVFSYYYYLTGEDESYIRSYFNKETITFFEHNKGYHLNICDGRMLLYKRTDLLTTEEIENTRTFIINLTNILKP